MEVAVTRAVAGLASVNDAPAVLRIGFGLRAGDRCNGERNKRGNDELHWQPLEMNPRRGAVCARAPRRASHAAVILLPNVNAARAAGRRTGETCGARRLAFTRHPLRS